MGQARSYMPRVWRTALVSDRSPALSPAAAALRLAHEPGLAWLDGGLTHGREGRFSFVACAPVEVQEACSDTTDPLTVLGKLSCVAREQSQEGREPSPGDDPDPELLPEDVPRWIGHVAYDAHPVASARFRHARSATLPLVRFARYDALYGFDHAQERAFVVGDDEAACARLVQKLERAPCAPELLRFHVGALQVTPAARHRAAIERALGHVRQGDVYEINLARRFAATFEGAPLGLFLAMRAHSPVPLGYYQAGAEHALLGRSMERFLRYRTRDRALWTSPIKGTIARQGDDAAEARTLQGDAKEHAEHAMVIDLMRNDLSHVCEIGSVTVEEAFTVLPFAGLSHLISTVRGRVVGDMSLDRLLAYTFPPGSVTGTPKVRALELIEELEDAPRGVYTGAYGFVDRAGGVSLAVAIRSALVAGGEVEYFAGGGIVWGSDPLRETAETELKAQVFLRAIAGG
jgi:anthranilate/para-aminobenzoate synthase component I